MLASKQAMVVSILLPALSQGWNVAFEISMVLRDVSHGGQILVMTRGSPIAKIVPVDNAVLEIRV